MTKEQIRQQIQSLKIEEGSEEGSDNTLAIIIAIIAIGSLIYLAVT